MRKIRLGKTGLQVTKTAFGALPIQRLSREDAVRLLRQAYESGINFFDTARGYTDSEEKIGYALSDVRDQIIIASKTPQTDRDGVLRDVETSLKKLKTDHIDLLQLHNPGKIPDPADPNSAWAGLMEAKRQGLIDHVGITNHRTEPALAAIESGLYETLQFPLSYLSSDRELELVKACAKHDIGLIAMKALSGGLITNARAAFAFLDQFESVVPIWGLQRESELAEFVALEKERPGLNAALLQIIQEDQEQLQGSFCRGCGYCLPCPQEIAIPMAARMSLLLQRAPSQRFLEAEWQEKMANIENCTRCGNCLSRCPYGLAIPDLLREELEQYRKVLSR